MTEQLDRPAAATCPFDHHSSDLKGLEKYLTYAALRERRVQRSELYGGFWILSHAADIDAALGDPLTYSSQRGGVFLPGAGSDIPFAGLEFDPPAHSGFRKLFARAVSRSALNAAEPQITALATRLVSDFAAAGGGDFVSAISAVLPVEAIAYVVGLPAEKATHLRELTEYGWEHIAEHGALAPMAEMLMGEIMARRAEPKDDYLSWICTAEIAGRPVTDNDILGILIGLLVAGHETTMNASANLAYLLGRDPALRARIVADPSITASVVEESLRYDSPVQVFTRVLTRDVKLDGTLMREGDRVMFLYGSANHDPEAFEQPDTFDPDRANLRHFSFGGGIHRCVGAVLSQLELRLLCTLLAACDYSVVGEPVYRAPSGGGAFSGMSSLQLAFA